MSKIAVNLKKSVKPMKKMHAGGQPPLRGADTSMFKYLSDAGIPYSRLHDVGGAFGSNRYVDIPNIFRDFDADVNDPASYDFTFTDFLIKALVDAGIEPYYRLGVTIENQCDIKPYYIYPPKDYKKWAEICEHIIMHYTEGWADGFKYNIEYWEIWNEPDNKQMWTGTPEEFFELYDVTAKHLKSRFPHLKIGGYASSGFYAVVPGSDAVNDAWLSTLVPYFYKFFAYIKEHNSPIDFFSWHSYANTANTSIMDKWLHGELENLGYAGLETHLNEWDPYASERGTAHHSAEVAAMMIEMQHGYTDVCCIYDMRTNYGTYTPLFDTERNKPRTAYYSMVAFNQLYRLGTEVECISDTEGLHALAALDGKHGALMLSNLTGESCDIEISGVDLSGAHFYVLDQDRLLSWSPEIVTLENNAVALIVF